MAVDLMAVDIEAVDNESVAIQASLKTTPQREKTLYPRASCATREPDCSAAANPSRYPRARSSLG